MRANQSCPRSTNTAWQLETKFNLKNSSNLDNARIVLIGKFEIKNYFIKTCRANPLRMQSFPMSRLLLFVFNFLCLQSVYFYGELFYTNKAMVVYVTVSAWMDLLLSTVIGLQQKHPPPILNILPLFRTHLISPRNSTIVC